MLKKKINGVWQNCSIVKDKDNGTWTDIQDPNLSNRRPLKRYTNGSWVRIYYPSLELMDYDLVTSKGSRTNSLTGSNSSATLSFNNYYNKTSKGTAEAKFGYISVQSGDTITASADGSAGNSYYLDRIEARAYLVSYTNPDDPTNYSNITSIYYYIKTPDYTNESSRNFSYTFTRSYNYVGFRLYVDASDVSSSTSYAYGNINIYRLQLNGASLYVTSVSIEK